MRSFLALLFFALLAFPGLADDKVTREDLARQFVEETRGAALPDSIAQAIWEPYEAQLRAYNPMITNDDLTAVKSVMIDGFSTLAERIKTKYAEIYARKLSVEELRGLLEFFRSSLGRTYMDVNAAVADEAAPEIRETMASLLSNLQRKLDDAARKRGLKLGGA